MTDKLAFSGGLEYVTYCIEKYLASGYTLTKFHPTNNEKFGKIIFVEMEKAVGTITLTGADLWVRSKDIRSSYSAFKAGFIKSTWTLQEQLEEAIELEDYEEAARLRDIINKQ